MMKIFSQNMKQLLNKNKRGFSNFYQDIKLMERGQIPSSLQYDRFYKQSTVNNGIQVCTEYWPSPIATLSIFIKCGSRNEQEENSGTAHFLEHLHFKGTRKRSKNTLEQEIENIGGQLNAYTSRENTSYQLTVFDNKLEHGVEILGDILCNSLYNKQAVQNERDTIYRELLETQKEQMETTVEISHQGCFKNHQMALPICPNLEIQKWIFNHIYHWFIINLSNNILSFHILGRISNIYSITRENVVEYHNKNYFGENIIIAGAGNIEHDKLCEYVEKYFSSLEKTKEQDLRNQQKPQFNTDIISLKSDITNDINVGLFYEAPSWLDADYFAFLILQRILNDKPQSLAEQEILNFSEINQFQKLLINYPDILIQKGVYTPYRDVGLFGNYYQCKENSVIHCINIFQQIFEKYSQDISDLEIERAKRRLYGLLCLYFLYYLINCFIFQHFLTQNTNKNITYIELLQHESGNDISQSIGNSILYFGRRMFRSEIAHRVASIDKQQLKNVVNKWFKNKQFSLTLWGNVEKLQNELLQK